MKLVPKNEFINLPQGTLFSLYSDAEFNGVYVKTSGSSEVVWYDGVFGSIAHDGDFEATCRAMEQGARAPMDFNQTSSSNFNEDQLFGVFEADDVDALKRKVARL